MVEKTFNFIVSGGEASGGPPIGPALGPQCNLCEGGSHLRIL